MKDRLKRRVNDVYGWMEANPATAILVSGACSAGLALALTAALGLYGNATYVQKSACSRSPASRECAELRQAVARAEPVKNPCISYQRVTSRKGRNCREFFVPRHPSHAHKAAGPGPGSPKTSAPTEPTSTSGTTHSQTSGPGQGGNAGAVPTQHHGGGEPHHPPKPAPVPAPAPTGAGTPHGPAPGSGSADPVHSVTEHAQHVVEKTPAGPIAGPVLESVGNTASCAVNPNC